MRILKLLNKRILQILFVLSFSLFVNAEEQPVDIWNIEKEKVNSENSNQTINNNSKENQKISESDIYKMQSQNQNNEIELEQTSTTQKVKIVGLYDPEDFSLNINMWLNSDGDQLKSIFNKIDKIKLSDDAKEIMNIAMLTNAYYPKKNILEKEYLNIKTNWLIKNNNLELIEDFLVKNQVFDLHSKLTKFLIDDYLSNSKLDKACEILSKNLEPLTDEYLSKFNIYCLIHSKKKEEAQILYDLKKELGFKNEYFEKKIEYLLGYTLTVDTNISEKNILNFHLAHKTIPNFSFEPKEKTKKIIWKYLSSSNLLTSFQEIDISELDKINTIEKAVNNRNYPEKDLFELYKRFQFNISQLLNAQNSYKLLSDIEGRALLYQKILLTTDMVEKLKLLKMLKESFKKDEIENAFDIELKKFLAEMNPSEIPDNLTSFYYTNIKINNNDVNKKTKFNNEVLHQSKLINYFNGDYSQNKIEKDVNNFLKKIKKNKKYFLSKKDIIFLDSLKSDGVQFEKKYEEMYQIDESEIPTDIQVMINNNEKAAVLLRIVEVIGQDDLGRIDEDTLFFIISALNQLNIDILRNKILLKVLPLKV